MTFAEHIVLTIIQAETAAAGVCVYEGLAERLAVYLDAEEIAMLMEGVDGIDLLDGFIHHLGFRNGIYLCTYGFRYGERASEAGIRV